MSGAFSIDIEVGSSANGIRIYCATLTHKWTVDKTKADVLALIQDFNHSKDVRKYLPKEPDFGIKEIKKRNKNLQRYFGALSCTARILRYKPFHDFLRLPDEVRETLVYCHDRSGGRVTRQGKIFVHNTFAKTDKEEMWLTLIDFESTSNLTIKKSKDATQVFSAFKIGRSAKIEKTESKEEENIFTLKSGEKIWKLQCAIEKEFKQWYSQLNQSIKKAGGSVDEESDIIKRTQSVQISLHMKNKKNKKETPDQIAKSLQLTNQELKQKLRDLKRETDTARDTIEDLIQEKEKLSSDQNQVRRQIKKQYEDRKQNQINRYELEHEKLRTQIEELHRKLEIKTMKEQGFKGIVRLFGEGYAVPDTELDEGDDTLDLIEFEEKQRGNEVDDSQVKWIHKHLHKHDHKNIYHHRHTHIHDDTQHPSVVYTQTHTVSHTICHTHTQLKIKRKLL